MPPQSRERKQGIRTAFAPLVERHSRSVFRLAYRLTGNEQDAEDVVQETFLRAYKQLENFESRASFGTWLYRIAANYSLDLIRSRKRHHEHRPAAEDEEDALLSIPASATRSGSRGLQRPGRRTDFEPPWPS